MTCLINFCLSGVSIKKHISQLALVVDHSAVSYTIITRNKRKNVDSDGISFITWEEVEKKGLPQCDAVVNLAGAPIIEGAWKKTSPVYTSRINTTKILVESMKKNPPKSFVQASAVGIYEANTKETLNENSSLLPYEKMNFAQQLVYDWETEASKAKEIKDLKTTILRFGFVLGREQNGVKAMKLPFGVGIGNMGSGKQHFPWIHEIDLAAMIFHAALDPDCTGGVVNAISPQVVSQEQFSKVFNRQNGTWINIPVPAFLLKLIGEKSFLLLDGANIEPKEHQNVLPSFSYSYPNLHDAIKLI